MINRRGFLIAALSQPLLMDGLFQLSTTIQKNTNASESHDAEYIVVGGWTLLKSDLLATES